MSQHGNHHRRRIPKEHDCPVILFSYLCLAIGLSSFLLGYGSGAGFYPDKLFYNLTGVGSVLGAALAIIWIGLRK